MQQFWCWHFTGGKYGPCDLCMFIVWLLSCQFFSSTIEAFSFFFLSSPAVLSSGWFAYTMPKLKQLEDGLSSCGLITSVRKHPHLWEKAFNLSKHCSEDGLQLKTPWTNWWPSSVCPKCRRTKKLMCVKFSATSF